MSTEYEIIARVHTEFKEKFGIPRQSGLVPACGKVIFEPKYRNPEAVRGLEGYSHIWLIWQFSRCLKGGRSLCVRPPRLGGNKKMGVFATRSPFRPNKIGLSSVKLKKVEITKNFGPVLHIEGVDMADGTPVLDIKPYLAFTDSHPDALCGFAGEKADYRLDVKISPELLLKIPKEHIDAVYSILENDPRPSYQNDGERIYGMSFAGMEIKFTVNGGVLCVCDIENTEMI